MMIRIVMMMMMMVMSVLVECVLYCYCERKKTGWPPSGVMHAETSVHMGNNSQVYGDDEDDRVNDHCEHDRISALILSVAIIAIRCNARRDLCAHGKQQPGI